jgi:hypothetical protein
VRFGVHLRTDNHEGTPQLVQVQAMCGPGDEGEPVFTVLMLEQDGGGRQASRPSAEQQLGLFQDIRLMVVGFVRQQVVLIAPGLRCQRAGGPLGLTPGLVFCNRSHPGEE